MLNSLIPLKKYFQKTQNSLTLTDDIKKIGVAKTPEEIAEALNQKLESLINEENYEDAARLRDYMFRNNIKRIK